MQSDLEPAAETALIGRMSDMSLLVGVDGVITRLSASAEDLSALVDAGWVGRPWSDTVTEEGRGKITELRELALARPGTPVRREVNHRLADGSDLPLQYVSIALGADGEVLALGRDMRPLATLRQQLVNAQQALEQDYWRLRQVETRYRLLFQMAGEAVLIVDDASGRVLEANPVAARILAPNGPGVIGKPFPLGFDPPGMQAVASLLAEARALGKSTVSGVHSAAGGNSLTVSVHLLRQDDESRLLVRLGTAAPVAGAAPDLSQLLRLAPDAVAITDGDGRVIGVNQAFVDLAQLVNREQALDQPVDRWLGRSGVDLSVLLSNLRQRGVVRLFTTAMRGELGAMADVEISASRLDEGVDASYAFFVRDVGLRLGAEDPMSARTPKSIEQLTRRVGRVPLKELVRESTDIIEALCIEAALQLTGDNRASAAELLGLSRQSLYAKLRRYRMGGLGGDEIA